MEFVPLIRTTGQHREYRCFVYHYTGHFTLHGFIQSWNHPVFNVLNLTFATEPVMSPFLMVHNRWQPLHQCDGFSLHYNIDSGLVPTLISCVFIPINENTKEEPSVTLVMVNFPSTSVTVPCLSLYHYRNACQPLLSIIVTVPVMLFCGMHANTFRENQQK